MITVEYFTGFRYNISNLEVRWFRLLGSCGETRSGSKFAKGCVARTPKGASRVRAHSIYYLKVLTRFIIDKSTQVELSRRKPAK